MFAPREIVDLPHLPGGADPTAMAGSKACILACRTFRPIPLALVVPALPPLVVPGPRVRGPDLGPGLGPVVVGPVLGPGLGPGLGPILGPGLDPVPGPAVMGPGLGPVPGPAVIGPALGPVLGPVLGPPPIAPGRLGPGRVVMGPRVGSLAAPPLVLARGLVPPLLVGVGGGLWTLGDLAGRVLLAPVGIVVRVPVVVLLPVVPTVRRSRLLAHMMGAGVRMVAGRVVRGVSPLPASVVATRVARAPRTFSMAENYTIKKLRTIMRSKFIKTVTTVNACPVECRSLVLTQFLKIPTTAVVLFDTLR